MCDYLILGKRSLIQSIKCQHVLIEIWLKEVIRVARERIVKDNPKRGKLTEKQIQQAVEKVIYTRLGRDAKTGKFISCKEAEHRKETAAVEIIKRPKKKK